jgi:hypothetical protein
MSTGRRLTILGGIVVALLRSVTAEDLPPPDPSVRSIPHGTLHRQREYCRPKNRKLKLCKKEEITLPVYAKEAPPFTREIARRLGPYLREYEASDPVKEVEEAFPDYEGLVGGEWYDTLSIGLYARTPTTYTLELDRSGYGGGAHGYYTVTFLNLLPGREAPVRLAECFRPGSEKRLLGIAEAYYRRQHGLPPGQPLTEEEWFEDRFVLSESFALTSGGILFLYNQYEIKPYSSGLTTFLLPYHALHGIIDPSGPLAFALK